MATPRLRPALEGELVRLRAREQADLSRLNAEFNDPEVSAGLMLAFPQPMAGIREWLERTRRSDDQAIFVIETLTDREAVGICGLEDIDARARRAEFGIWIARPHWRNGYGTDATRTACRFAFRYMNLRKVELHTYPETNARAVRTYEKVGFKMEGLLREAQFLDGRYIDVAVMGLFESDLLDTR